MVYVEVYVSGKAYDGGFGDGYVKAPRFCYCGGDCGDREAHGEGYGTAKHSSMAAASATESGIRTAGMSTVKYTAWATITRIRTTLVTDRESVRCRLRIGP